MIILMLALVFPCPFQVTAERVTAGLIISAPDLPEGKKYGSVSIYDGTSNPEPIQIASNLWLSDLESDSGMFSAIICTDHNCTPVKAKWETDGTIHDDDVVMSPLEKLGELAARILTICIFLSMLLGSGWYIINKKWKS